MLCLLGVSTLRWVSARELQQYQLRMHLPQSKSQIIPADDLTNGAAPPGENQAEYSNIAVGGGDTERTAYDWMYSARSTRPIDEHIRILHAVIALKKRGAAGGRHVDIRGRLPSKGYLAVVPAWFFFLLLQYEICCGLFALSQCTICCTICCSDLSYLREHSSCVMPILITSYTHFTDA